MSIISRLYRQSRLRCHHAASLLTEAAFSEFLDPSDLVLSFDFAIQGPMAPLYAVILVDFTSSFLPSHAAAILGDSWPKFGGIGMTYFFDANRFIHVFFLSSVYVGHFLDRRRCVKV